MLMPWAPYKTDPDMHVWWVKKKFVLLNFFKFHIINIKLI